MWIVWIVLAVVVGVSALAFVIGSLLPEEYVHSEKRRLNAAPEQVWQVLEDPGAVAVSANTRCAFNPRDNVASFR